MTATQQETPSVERGRIYRPVALYLGPDTTVEVSSAHNPRLNVELCAAVGFGAFDEVSIYGTEETLRRMAEAILAGLPVDALPVRDVTPDRLEVGAVVDWSGALATVTRVDVVARDGGEPALWDVTVLGHLACGGGVWEATAVLGRDDRLAVVCTDDVEVAA